MKSRYEVENHRLTDFIDYQPFCQNGSNHSGSNINLNVDTSWIISSFRKENHIFCLAACNSNKECLTAVYMESEIKENCFLYQKHFVSTETTTSSNTKLFKKDSKYRNNKK